MKLNYITPPTHAGGAAVPGVGTIYINEITATLNALSDDMELPFDLNNFRIGSTGKRLYSGDLDIVLDRQWYSGSSRDVYSDLLDQFGPPAVRKTGAMVHLAYPISNYDKTKNEVGPRTGYVQVDFYLGDYEWEYFYHYSCSNSAYKGAHRNLAIAAVAGTKDCNVINPELDQLGRHLKEIRYKWGQNGLLRVERTLVENTVRQGHYNKAPQDLILGGPWKNPGEIVLRLFSNGTPEDLNSLETIISAVKRDFDLHEQEVIFKRIAKNFSEWPDGKNFYYPSEIEPFIHHD
jgi:hypothetical protein